MNYLCSAKTEVEMKYKKKLSPEFKTQVALDAIRESMPLAEIAKKYEITPSMVSELKEEFIAGASQVFAPKTEQSEHQEVVRLKKRESDLLRKIGQLQVDNDFFASACEDAGLKVR